MELIQLHQKELEQLNSKHIDSIELYQAKYKILLEELEKGTATAKTTKMKTTTVEKRNTPIKGTKSPV